jgi:hypothetical protein
VGRSPVPPLREQIMWLLTGYLLSRVIIDEKIYSWYFHVEVGLFIYLNFYRIGVFTFSSAAEILSGQKAGW